MRTTLAVCFVVTIVNIVDRPHAFAENQTNSSGVVFTRNPQTGEPEKYYLRDGKLQQDKTWRPFQAYPTPTPDPRHAEGPNSKASMSINNASAPPEEFFMEGGEWHRKPRSSKDR